MRLSTYLIFNGDCKAAFQFYARCLDGNIVAMHTYAEAPEECVQETPPEHRDKIMHARLEIDGQWLMGSDITPQCPAPYEAIKGAHITLNIDTPEDAERIFQALADNGTVQMPLEETFWAKRFAMLTDKYGVPWMINCEKEV